MTAFHPIQATRSTPRSRRIFVFGDHASNHIPAALGNLGLSGDDLTRHIAWDIGTDATVRGLCAHFGCAGQVAGTSRLVIDVHRDLDSPGLIPESSDGTDIPGNLNLGESERARRIDTLHRPYHQALGQAVDALPDPLVVSIHSFTPKPKTGAARKTEIGLLVKQDIETAERCRQNLRALNPPVCIGWNDPYSAFDLFYTIDETVAPRGLRHLCFEVRQDLLDSPEKQRDITTLLTRVLTPLI